MSGFDEVREMVPEPCEIRVERTYPGRWLRYTVKAVKWIEDPSVKLKDRLQWEAFIGFATTPERGLRKGERWARRNGHVVVKRVKFDAP